MSLTKLQLKLPFCRLCKTQTGLACTLPPFPTSLSFCPQSKRCPDQCTFKVHVHVYVLHNHLAYMYILRQSRRHMLIASSWDPAFDLSSAATLYDL